MRGKARGRKFVSIWGSSGPPIPITEPIPPEPEPGTAIVWQPRLWQPFDTVIKPDFKGAGTSASMDDFHGGSVNKLWERYGIDAWRGTSQLFTTILGGSAKVYFYGATREASAASAIQWSAPIYEAWCMFGISIDPNNVNGQIDGVKLCGMGGYESSSTTAPFNFRMWHSLISNNQVELKMYPWGYDWPPQTVETFPSHPMMTLGEIYFIRQYLKLNSIVNGVPQPDGRLKLWFMDQVIYDRSDLRIRVSEVVDSSSEDRGDICHFWAQIFHGGSQPPVAPLTYELGGLQVSFTGLPDLPTPITLSENINFGSWSNTWNQTPQQDSMRYACGYLDPYTGNALEFCVAGHSRATGDSVGVRYQGFDQNGLTAGGYLWNNNDPAISETDNMTTLFLPWNRWVMLPWSKIIDTSNSPNLGTPIFRHNQNTGVGSGTYGTDFWNSHFEITLGNGAGANNYQPWNPAQTHNPGASDQFVVYFGGGYGSSFRGSGWPAMTLVRPNPNYPGSSTKPLALKTWLYDPNTYDAPLMARNAVKIGNYLYWGGTRQQDPAGTIEYYDRTPRFYRINLTTLEASFNTGTIPQVRIADCPTPGDGYFSALMGDEQRRFLIFIDTHGVWRYLIDYDRWQGPFTFGHGSANWQTFILGGLGEWAGVIGYHRSNLNKTFFRSNSGINFNGYAKRWHMLNWNNFSHTYIPCPGF